MTFLQSAVLLAWVAVVLLALGMAGLLRQVQLLSRAQLGTGGEPGPSAPAAPGATRTARDLVGFRLPASGELAQLPDRASHRTVLVFVSPGCPSCTQTLEGLAALPAVMSGQVAVVAVSTGSCEPADRALGGVGRCLPQGRHLLERLRVPATPYLIALDRDGTVVAASLPDPDTDLAAWVGRTDGALHPSEEIP